MSQSSVTNPRIRDFLDIFAPPSGRRAWYGGATLLGSLRGVKAEQAAWQAPGHDHSIWQLLLHCSYSRYNIRRLFEGKEERGGFPRPGAYWAKLPDLIDEASWSEDKALLRSEHQRLVEAVLRSDAARLDENATQEYTFEDLLWGIVMHDMYHTGEMQVLKRLYELHSP